MFAETTITLKGKEAYGRRLPPASFGAFLESLGPVTRQSVQMAFQRRSASRGRVPPWLQRAADVRFVGHRASDGGDTDLLFEAPELGEAAKDVYLQAEFWSERPAATDTALDLFADVITAVGSGDPDSRWLDAPLLRNIGGFQRCLDGTFSSALLRPPRYVAAPVVLDASVASAAKALQASAPLPRRMRIVGKLDMVRISTETFRLQLADGTGIDGVLTSGGVAGLAPLLSQRVVVRGCVVYRPSGRPLRIDADSVETATDESRLWLSLPSAVSRAPVGLRRPQTPRTGLAAIIGKWPGSESDEEIAEVLERLS